LFSVHVADFGLARTKVQMYAKTSGNLGAVKWLAPEGALYLFVTRKKLTCCLYEKKKNTHSYCHKKLQ
jgi:hypothetical protein